MVFKTNEPECYKDVPAIGMQLGDGDFMKVEDIKIKQINWESETRL